MSKKIVSMSVYGTKPMYVRGAIANARLIPQVFPGWTMRVYCCLSDCSSVEELKGLGCEIVAMPRSRIHSGMFWRFLAAWDPEAERVIIRDSDSRLNIRDWATVQAWEESGKDAHCIMDHPHHSQMPMSGGMWGIKARVLPPVLLEDLQRRCRRPQPRVEDMRWLRDRVHPLIQGSLLRHSSVSTKWPSVPFPDHSPYEGFVGQQYDGAGIPIWPK